MELWKISQQTNCGYDTYDSAVVAAEDDEQARGIYPGTDPGEDDYYRQCYWVTDLTLVTVLHLGTAAEDTEAGVICTSFNAG